MSTALTIKKGDTRDWRFSITDAVGAALDLTNAVAVEFRVRTKEWSSTNLFDRNTAGAGSDYITVSDATNGVVLITPTASDWAAASDSGVHVAEFRVTDVNSDVSYVQDIEVVFEETNFE